MRSKIIFLIPIIILTVFLNVYAEIDGDVNGDNKVTSADYVLLRKYIMGSIKLDAKQVKRSDVNKDNKVNAQDYVYIKKIIMGALPTPTATPKVTPTPSPTPKATPTPTSTPTPTQSVKTKYTEQFDITFFRGVFARYLDDTQIQYMKDAYFTLVALEDDWVASVSYDEYKNNMINAIKKLDKQGLRVNVYDWMAMWRNFGYEGGKAICSYSGSNTKSCLDQMIADYGSYPNVEEYYILDEPGSSNDSIAALKYAIDYIREKSLGREGYINLLPNYAYSVSTYRSSYLEPLASGVKAKVLSVDHYPQMFLGANVNTSKEQYYNNLWDLHVVSEKYNQIPMMIVLLSQHGSYKNLSRSEIAYQVSTSLAFGMKRISYFTYSVDGNSGLSNALVDRNHNRTTHYYDVQSVNKWALKLGRYLFDKKIVSTSGLNEISYMGNYNAWYSDIKASHAAIKTVFNDNSYMLVNTEILPTPATNTFTFESMEGLHYYDTDSDKWVKITGSVSKDTFVISLASKAISISPGGCILLKGRYWEQDSQGYWYYKEIDGSNVKSKWVYYNTKWYYLGSDGKMYANTTQTIDGVSYHFNTSGACDSGPGC